MEFRIAYANNLPSGGTFTTPLWFGIHDEGFDLFETGEAASEGLEAIAEDGTFDAINAELLAADPGAQAGAAVGSAIPPIGPGDIGSATIDVADPDATMFMSYAAMILPSNDAFIGSANSREIFDGEGNFLGEQNRTFTGADIYDAGTEVNTELDAAFLNQSAPDTGIDQGGVIRLHPGFIGSRNNPASEFDQEVLGGTTAAGAVIDPAAGDFTIDRDAPIGTFHVNAVNRYEGGHGRDVFVGGATDDLANGGGGRDVILGRDGWDVLSGGARGDIIFGGAGQDIVSGDGGIDFLRGGRGADIVSGGRGADIVQGNAGNDIVSGGAGNDFVRGGGGADRFVIELGAEIDLLRDFRRAEGDVVDLSAFDTSFDELAITGGTLSNGVRGTSISLDDGTVVEFQRLASVDFTADDFLF